MSVHYEIYGDEPEMIDKNVRIWHDGDDSVVYDGRYGDLLTDMSDDYSTDEDVGVLWDEMSCFNDDYADKTPKAIAYIAFEGNRVKISHLDGKAHFVMLPHFDSSMPVYGRSGDGPIVSFENWRCLEWWLAREINIHCFLSWVADNMMPKGKGVEP